MENSNYPFSLIKTSSESHNANIALVTSLPIHLTRIKTENLRIPSHNSLQLSQVFTKQLRRIRYRQTCRKYNSEVSNSGVDCLAFLAPRAFFCMVVICYTIISKFRLLLQCIISSKRMQRLFLSRLC